MERYKIGEKISIIYKYLQIMALKSFQDMEINPSEFPFILTVIENEGICQEELSEKLRVNKSATTKVVRGLIKKGYLIRKKDSLDRRYYRVYSTEKSRRLRSKILHKVEVLSKVILGDFNEKELEELYGFLDKLEDNIFRNCKYMYK